jgi:hypothetical protein
MDMKLNKSQKYSDTNTKTALKTMNTIQKHLQQNP